MKNKNGVSRKLKKLPSDFFEFLKRQLKKLLTIDFWKKAALATFIVMGCVGSYVTLKAFSFTKPAVMTVEKPVVRAWKAFNDDSYTCTPKKKYKKSKYSKRKKYKKRKYSKSRYKKKRRSGRYAKR